jgi:predicted nuclease with TOPRIM domain
MSHPSRSNSLSDRIDATHAHMLEVMAQITSQDKTIQVVTESIKEMSEQIGKLSASTQILSNNDVTITTRLSEAEKRLGDHETRRFDLNMENLNEHKHLSESILLLQSTITDKINAAVMTAMQTITLQGDQSQQRQIALGDRNAQVLISIGLVVIGAVISYFIQHLK